MFLICVVVLLHVCMVPAEARRKDIRNSRTGVTEVYEPPHESWEPNPGPLERSSYAINHWTIYPCPCFFLSKLLKFFQSSLCIFTCRQNTYTLKNYFSDITYHLLKLILVILRCLGNILRN